MPFIQFKHVEITIILLISLSSFLGCSRGINQYNDHLFQDCTPVKKGVISCAWLGTAGFLIEDDKTAILIDPFVSYPSAFKVLLCPIKADEKRVDYWIDKLEMIGDKKTKAVLVSHSHYDHSLDAPSFAKKLGAKLYGSKSTQMIGFGSEIQLENIKVIVPGQKYKIDNFDITFIKSVHSDTPDIFAYKGEINCPLEQPARVCKFREGESYTILIEHKLGTILHIGSAGIMPEMLKGIEAHTVLLGIYSRGCTAKFLSEVCEVKPERIIPCHFDYLFKASCKRLKIMPGSDLKEFFEIAENNFGPIDFKTMEIGRKTILFPEEN